MKMGRKRFWTGIVIGAIAGGLTTLLDRETRNYVKKTCSEAKSTTQFYLNNPSLTVSKVRGAVQTLNANLAKGAETAMNTLDKLEQSLDKQNNQNQDIHRIE